MSNEIHQTTILVTDTKLLERVNACGHAPVVIVADSANPNHVALADSLARNRHNVTVLVN
jgi:hypothetical protein